MRGSGNNIDEGQIKKQSVKEFFIEQYNDTKAQLPTLSKVRCCIVCYLLFVVVVAFFVYFMSISRMSPHISLLQTRGSPLFGSCFSIFNCNIRSLGKNLCLLNDILITVKEMPSIITISETKLNDNNQHLHNINIPGYNFVGVNSRTNAEGVGIYIKQNLNFFSQAGPRVFF